MAVYFNICVQTSEWVIIIAGDNKCFTPELKWLLENGKYQFILSNKIERGRDYKTWHILCN
jgi:hypothetical protein